MDLDYFHLQTREWWFHISPLDAHSGKKAGETDIHHPGAIRVRMLLVWSLVWRSNEVGVGFGPYGFAFLLYAVAVIFLFGCIFLRIRLSDGPRNM